MCSYSDFSLSSDYYYCIYILYNVYAMCICRASDSFLVLNFWSMIMILTTNFACSYALLGYDDGLLAAHQSSVFMNPVV